MLTDGAIVIINKETGKVVAEFQNPALVDKLNTDKFKAIPILEHLQSLNKGNTTQEDS